MKKTKTNKTSKDTHWIRLCYGCLWLYFQNNISVISWQSVGGGNQCTRRKWNIPSPIIQSNPKTDYINFRKSSKVIGFSDHEGHIYILVFILFIYVIYVTNHQNHCKCKMQMSVILFPKYNIL